MTVNRGACSETIINLLFFSRALGSHFSRKRDLHSAPVEKRLIEFSSEKDSRWRTSQKRTTFLPGMGMERSRIRPSSKTGAVPYPSLFSEMYESKFASAVSMSRDGWRGGASDAVIDDGEVDGSSGIL